MVPEKTNTEKLLNFYSKNENEFTNKMSNAIIDPSIFTSTDYVSTLLESLKKPQLFISKNLKELFEEGRGEFVLDYFSWKKNNKNIPEISYKLIEKSIPFSYLNVSYNEKMYNALQNQKIPNEINQILMDEFQFLLEHSVLLARYRKTKQYLQQAGVTVVDLGQKIVDIKTDFSSQYRNVTFLFHLLFKAGKVMQLDSISPLADVMFDVVDYTLYVFDP